MKIVPKPYAFLLALPLGLVLTTAAFAQYQYPRYQQSYPTYPQYQTQQYQAPQYGTPVPNYGGQTIYQGNRVYVQPGQARIIQGQPRLVTGQPIAQPAQTASSRTFKQPWYQTLLKDKAHDFGTVAYASRQEKIFEFVNNTGSDLFLTGIKASCGCTKPEILTKHVKPGEKGRVLTKYDTLAFYGKRGATITVSLQKSANQIVEYGELQLTVKGDIRRDVVFSPGEIDFKSIALADPVQTSLKIMYAGRTDWKIVEIRSTNENISATAREIERNASTGRTTYEMVVKVKDTQPVGSFADTLTIVTNDPKTTGMSLSVGGKIKPTIQIAPVTLGVVNKGQKISKKLIVRSPKAITIESVETGNEKIKFEPSEGKKTLHILKYTLDTSEPINIDQAITVFTEDQTIRKTTVPFSVQVVPSTTTVGQQ